jgi:hypothetical protein
MKIFKVQNLKFKVPIFILLLFTVHSALGGSLFTVGNAGAEEKAKKYPNWYEIHIRQSVVKEDGSGLAQRVADDLIGRAIQARRPDGLNPQACIGCHSKAGPGSWLYGNPKYDSVRWKPAQKYKKTAADKVEVKRPYITDIKTSE